MQTRTLLTATAKAMLTKIRHNTCQKSIKAQAKTVQANCRRRAAPPNHQVSISVICKLLSNHKSDYSVRHELTFKAEPATPTN